MPNIKELIKPKRLGDRIQFNQVKNYFIRHIDKRVNNIKLPGLIIVFFSCATIVIFLAYTVLNIFSNLETAKNLIFQKSPTSETHEQSILPETSNQAKVLKAATEPCNATNNFENSIWEKKNSFRIVSTNPDTNDSELLGAKTEHPYQSQMIYPFDCPLPLVATISAVIASTESAGLQFEYEGVFQVILGDGDRKAIRYKKDTLGIRNEGWVYIKEKPLDKKKITHWLPYNIAIGSQVDLTIKTYIEEGQIIIATTVDYKPAPENEEYAEITFNPDSFLVKSFNIKKNTGRRIRVGINDKKFEGKQSEINFKKFSISPI